MTLYRRRILKGLMRSWTAHAGVYIAVLGYLQTQGELLTQWLGEDAVGGLMMLFGLVVVALRAKTSESLESKGAR